MAPSIPANSHDDLIRSQIIELRLVSYRLEKALQDEDKAALERELQAAKTGLESMIGSVQLVNA